MRADDLHVEDLAARVRLRAELHAARLDLALSAEAVSRLAGFPTPGAVGTFERQQSWEAWRVQQWARGVGRVFQMRLTGIDVAPDDVVSLVLKSTTAFGGFDADRLHLRIVVGDLVRTRLALSVSRCEMARRCGVTERAISGWELNPDMSLLRVFQRYGRALGGAVALDLTPAFAGVTS